MPHLHLSMQSGDDLTLKRMKRRHSRADADRVLRADAQAPVRRRIRRRSDRRFSNRNGRHVRKLAKHRRCLRPDLSARLSVFCHDAARRPPACRRCRAPSSRSGRRSFARKAARCSPPISTVSEAALSMCSLKGMATAARRNSRKSRWWVRVRYRAGAIVRTRITRSRSDAADRRGSARERSTRKRQRIIRAAFEEVRNCLPIRNAKPEIAGELRHRTSRRKAGFSGSSPASARRRRS